MSRNAAPWVMRSGPWTALLPKAPGVPRVSGVGGGSRGRGCYFLRCSPCCPSTRSGLGTVAEDVLLHQGAADLLIGSQEDEAAHTDEGHPRYAARKQTADKEEKGQHML